MFLIAAIPATAQNPDAAKVFEHAKSLYDSGQYDSTVSYLRQYLKAHGRDSSAEYLAPLIMEALIRTEQFDTFQKLAGIYERKYANSPFYSRVTYLQGYAASRREQYNQAIRLFSRALAMGLAGDLDSLALRNVRLICENALTVSELEMLAQERDLDPRIKEIVAYHEFAALYRTGQELKAKRRAETFKSAYPSSPYIAFAKDLISKVREDDNAVIRVGLLAPISGYDADVGKQVVQGVQLAIDEHNAVNTPEVKLIISDTKGSMIETARKTRELAYQLNVPIIIGPVLSQNAIVTASMLMDRPNVMITPTATDEGIASMSDNLFQVNVTLGMLGKRIARYAVKNCNIKEFAIIAPLSEYGGILSEAFKEEVKKHGAEIVAEEYYDEGATDYRIQFESLRSKLLFKRLQNMAVEDGVEYAQEKYVSRADSINFLDSTLSVGGLFIPAESEDVVMLAPQTAFYRIRTQLLGSTGWHTPKTLLDGKRYVNDALISTSFEIDVNDKQWIDFSHRYKRRFRMNPDRVAAPLGYDAAQLVLRAVKEGGDDPAAIARKLAQTENYKGVSGTVSFDSDLGANKETAIMKIKDKSFVRIQ